MTAWWVSADEMPDFVPASVKALALRMPVHGDVEAARHLVVSSKMKVVWSRLKIEVRQRPSNASLDAVDNVLDLKFWVRDGKPRRSSLFNLCGIDDEFDVEDEILAAFFYEAIGALSQERLAIRRGQVDKWISDYASSSALCRRDQHPFDTTQKERQALDIAASFFQRNADIIMEANRSSPFVIEDDARKSRAGDTTRAYLRSILMITNRLFATPLYTTAANVVNVAKGQTLGRDDAKNEWNSMRGQATVS